MTAFLMEYLASNGIRAACEVETFTHNHEVTIVVTDIDQGPSVTNFAEDIATELVARGVYFDHYIEHYANHPEQFDRVTFTWDEQRTSTGRTRHVACNVHWSPLGREKLEKLIGRPYPGGEIPDQDLRGST